MDKDKGTGLLSTSVSSCSRPGFQGQGNMPPKWKAAIPGYSGMQWFPLRSKIGSPCLSVGIASRKDHKGW